MYMIKTFMRGGGGGGRRVMDLEGGNSERCLKWGGGDGVIKNVSGEERIQRVPPLCPPLKF